jgi:1,4-alpha-glucan branching enzyme
MIGDDYETRYPERAAALRLNPVRLRIAADVVYAQEARGCDDWEWPKYVPRAERRALIDDFSAWNGAPEEAKDRRELGLYEVKRYLIAALLKHARETVKG